MFFMEFGYETRICGKSSHSWLICCIETKLLQSAAFLLPTLSKLTISFFFHEIILDTFLEVKGSLAV